METELNQLFLEWLLHPDPTTPEMVSLHGRMNALRDLASEDFRLRVLVHAGELTPGAEEKTTPEYNDPMEEDSGRPYMPGVN